MSDLKFLKSQLLLFANLCLNRNFNACQTFSEIFPLRILCMHLLNNAVDDELRAVILRLILNIYIDKEPRIIQHRPNLVRMIESEGLLGGGGGQLNNAAATGLSEKAKGSKAN